MNFNVGIYSVGMYLPDPVRTNDWWPTSVLGKWKERAEHKLMRSTDAPEGSISDGTRKVLAALQEWSGDAFMGVKQRHIIPDDMLASDMETRAAQDAIQRAGIDPQDIDLVLCCAMGPDYLLAPTGCAVHHNLGLKESCFTTEISAACNTLAMQLTLADQMIKMGQAKYALLLQSSTLSRLCPMEDPSSAWFGDGATALVVGPVAPDKGLLASTHRTYGQYHRSMVLGVPGKRWHEGPSVPYSDDRRGGRDMILRIADRSKEVVTEVMQKAKVEAEQVDFYVSHQATPWLRPVTQEHIGLTNARYTDTFPWTASLVASNAAAQLAVSERENVLRDGDLLATFTVGSGSTCSGLIVRWGR